MEERIRGILASDLILGTMAYQISSQEDLNAAGVDSFRMVQIMLDLEQEFALELPDHLLRPETFSSIESIVNAMLEIEKSGMSI